MVENRGILPTWVQWCTAALQAFLALYLATDGRLPLLAVLMAFFAGGSAVLALQTPKIEELQRRIGDER